MAKLLSYGIVDTAYSTGAAGDIAVSGSPGTVTVNKNQVTGLNGDPEKK